MGNSFSDFDRQRVPVWQIVLGMSVVALFVASAFASGTPATLPVLPVVTEWSVDGSIRLPDAAKLYVLSSDLTTERIVRQGLAAFGVQVGVGTFEGEATGEASVPGFLSVIMATEGDLAARLGQLPQDLGAVARSVAVPPGAEGYTVQIGEADSGPYMLLVGRDRRGMHYAAQTLLQVLASQGRGVNGERQIVAGKIQDRPAFGIRGIIEGFYGPPWSHQTRLDLIEFMGKYKLNTFVYAPKDDPYHRSRWREPYPQAMKERLGELVAQAERYHVDFVFAISPGLSIEYGSDSDFERLVEKTDAMWELGVRHFALLLDDIDRELAHAADRERFDNDLGAAHAFLVNRYNRYLQEKGAAPLIMVPVDYSQPGPTTYRVSLAQHIDRDVLIFWTGIGVVPRTITADEARYITSIFGNELLIWDNYPVNDFQRTRLFLGPLTGRDPDLAYVVAGSAANPMNEGEASKLPLITVASFLWNPQAYDAETVWDEALRRMGGTAYPALRKLAEVSTESILHPDASTPVGELVDALWPAVEGLTASTGPSSGVILPSEVVAELKREFVAWQQVPSQLAQGLPNHRLYQEIGLYAEKMRRYGKAGEAALAALDALVRTAEERTAPEVRSDLWEAYYSVKLAMNQAKTLSQEIAAGRLQEFLTRVEAAAHLALHPRAIPRPYTNYTAYYGDFIPHHMVDGDPTTFFWTNRGARPGDFVGVDLGEVQLVNGVSVQFNQTSGQWARPNDYPKAARVQVSVDGIVWHNVGFTTTPTASLEFEPIEARYVRIYIMTNQNEWVQVTDITVRRVDGAAPEISSTLIGDVGPVVDSLLSSYVHVPRGAAGELLRLTVPNTRELAGVEVFARPDRPVDGALLEASADGEEWFAVGTLNGAYGFWSFEAVPVQVGHVRLMLDHPLEADGYLHEIVLH